jgi:hypothetical protein
MDIEGRVDKFKARADAAKKAKEARMKAAGKTRAKEDDEDADEDSRSQACQEEGRKGRKTCYKSRSTR